MNIDFKKHIILFENCQLTRGVKRTLLVDFQRRNLEFLDNEIYHILIQKSRKYSIQEILQFYNSDEQRSIIEYFDFLIEKEYAFLCDSDEVNLFPRISKQWDHPALITNSIIDFNQVPKNIEPYKRLIHDLEDLGCEDVQVRCYKELPLNFLKSLFHLFEKTSIVRIEILLKHSGISMQDYLSLFSKYPRISKIQVHSAPKTINKIVSKNQAIQFSKNIVENEKSCGCIHPMFFNLRLEHFLESQHFNSCLNRKVCINTDGYIKNCPSLKSSFGNIKNISIKKVVHKENFRKIWTIKKDKINNCKICEFRHICTDCRAYLESDYSLEKPINCPYSSNLEP